MTCRFIDSGDIVRTMKELGEGVSVAEARQMVQGADQDKDGRINYTGNYNNY